MSVDRCNNLSDDQLVHRSEIHAQRGNNRIGNGAFVAGAGEIRALTDSAGNRAFRIYDDPLEGNHEHCVIRGCSEVAEEERSFVMIDLEELFSRNRRP